MATYDFERQIYRTIESTQAIILSRPLNLGGVSTSGGGGGGPPGGFTGQLPQSRVTYDMLEDATNYTPLSGYSVLDNLNHIRYRITNLENQNNNLEIQDDNSTIITNATILNFGSNLTVTDNGAGKVTITASGGGAALSDDTPSSLGVAASGVSNLASRGDHVHPHGNLSGGSLHSVASVINNGFMPSLTGNASEYLNGNGSWTTISGGLGNVATDAIWTDKGDLAVGLSAGSASVLSEAWTGQVLRANTALAKGVRWETVDIHTHTSEDHSSECDGLASTFTTWNYFRDYTTDVFLNGLYKIIDVDYTTTYNNFINFSSPPSGGSSLVFNFIVKNDPFLDADYHWVCDDFTAYADNDPISSWIDSISGVELYQDTLANQPVAKDGVVVGKKVVRFTSANSSFLQTLAPLTRGKNSTFYVVFNLRTATTVEGLFFKDGADATGIGFGIDNTYLSYLVDGVISWQDTWKTLSPGTYAYCFRVLDVPGQTPAVSFTLRGGGFSYGASGVSRPVGGFYLGGKMGAGDTPSNFTDIDVMEMYVFNRWDSGEDVIFNLNTLNSTWSTDY